MHTLRKCALLLLSVSAVACASHRQGHRGTPPTDPIAAVSAAELRTRGLAFARVGDLTRAQQYLGAAQLKGFDSRIIVPELVKICVAASRLRAALLYAEPYLERYPGDVGMRYVVGTLHLALGNLRRAASHLDGALQPGDLMIDAAFSLALAARGDGRRDDVQRHLEHYLRVRPQGRYATRARRILATMGAEHDPS